MGALHTIARVLAVSLIVLAPLACVRFCELRAAVTGADHGATFASALAAAHAPRRGAHVHAQAHAHGGEESRRHPPLRELQKAIAAVTEFVTSPVVVLTLVVLSLAAASRMPWPRHMSLGVPKPPPRPTFALA
jgi:hypothetical protein